MRRFLPILFALLFPRMAAAYQLTDSGWDCTGFAGCATFSTNVIGYLMNRLLFIVSTFLFALTVLVFFYGAIRMAVSQGEEGKDTGKKAMIYAALGFVCALLLSGMFRFVCDTLYGLGAGSLGAGAGICSTWWW